MRDPALAEAEHQEGSELVAMAAEVRALAEEARAYAVDELAFQKARAGHAGKGAKGIAIFAVLALVLIYFALMALVMGVVIALGTTILGPWGAAIAGFLGLIVLAGLCGLIARSKLTRLKGELSAAEPAP